MRTKLLHYSTVSAMASCVTASCCFSLSNSLNGFCSAYAMFLAGVCYGLLSGLSCKENVLSKHPLPIKISSISPRVVFFFYLSTCSSINFLARAWKKILCHYF